MNPNNNRSMLFGVVGGYLLYLAYELLKNLIDDVSTTMPRWLHILCVVFFAVMGVLLLVFAWKFWKKGREESAEDRVEIGDGDERNVAEAQNSGEETESANAGNESAKNEQTDSET
jgi:predicted PurR-regulated permease PerM